VRLRSLNPIVAYYLATPAFAVADLVFGVPVRLAGIADAAHRLVYYVVVFSLGILCRLRPTTAPFVGMAESTVNLLVLLLSILLPIWSLPDAVLSGAPLDGGLTGMALGNALLSGTALVVSFHRSQAAAARQLLGRGGRR
jgi:hypothetical protein